MKCLREEIIMVKNNLLTRGAAEVIEKEHLEQALRGSPSTMLRARKLRVKFGIDPTAPDLHLGHTVLLRKLRQFQDAGHKAILIIGDFTAKIGDPSGRDKTRSPLSDKEIKNNFKTYLNQAGKVLDVKKAEIRHNSEWFGKNQELILELASKMSMERVLEREDFQKRIRAGQEVTMLEALYPILQGYDSVAVKSDVEIGGNDQKFNLLLGRELQRDYGQEEQVIMLLPLLEGTDGIHKMSKSLGNYIGINESPDELFGKIMSIPDILIAKYFTALTPISDEEIDKIEADINSGEINPRDAKILLSFEIVKTYHGEKKAKEAAEAAFVTVLTAAKTYFDASPRAETLQDIEDVFSAVRAELGGVFGRADELPNPVSRSLYGVRQNARVLVGDLQRDASNRSRNSRLCLPQRLGYGQTKALPQRFLEDYR